MLGFALLSEAAAGAVDGFGGCFDLIRVRLVSGDAANNSPMVGAAERLRPLAGAAAGTLIIVIGSALLARLVDRVFAGGSGGSGNAGCFFSGGLDLLLDFSFGSDAARGSGCCFGGATRDLLLVFSLGSEAARLVIIFEASGTGSIFGVGFSALGADVARFLMSTAALVASDLGFSSLFLTPFVLGGGAIPAGGGGGPGGGATGSIAIGSRGFRDLPLVRTSFVGFLTGIDFTAFPTTTADGSGPGPGGG